MTDKSMTGLTLHKCALALAAILIATPALDAAPDSTAGDEPQSGSEQRSKNKVHRPLAPCSLLEKFQLRRVPSLSNQ